MIFLNVSKLFIRHTISPTPLTFSSRNVQCTQSGKSKPVKQLYFSLCLLLASTISMNAQAQTRLSAADYAAIDAVEDTLGLLAYAFVNDSLPENRFVAVQAFIPKLVQALKHQGSFSYPFEQLHAVSIQYPPDSTFRIFTWQLYVDKDTYRYYGAIQMNTPELQLFPLVDRSFEIVKDPEYIQLEPKDWYGSVYYNLYPVQTAEQTHYLLFGFDGYEFFRKRKVVDVLTFVDGKPSFGAPVFIHANADGTTFTKNRLLLEYSAAASVRCNFDPVHEIILFDHLIAMDGEHREGEVHIPDGTYSGYQLENGKWQYIEKVFHEVLDEAPRPSPVLGSKAKDIFGRGGK